MGLLQSALELQQFVGDATRIDLVGARADGLLHRGHFRGVDDRRLGDGLFDLLQGTRGVGQRDVIAGLCRGAAGAAAFALRLCRSQRRCCSNP